MPGLFARAEELRYLVPVGRKRGGERDYQVHSPLDWGLLRTNLKRPTRLKRPKSPSLIPLANGILRRKREIIKRLLKRISLRVHA